MVEKKIRRKEDILELLSEFKKQQGITFVEIERNTEIGEGTISRWKKVNPRLNTLIQALDFLGAEMFIRTALEPEVEKKIRRKEDILELLSEFKKQQGITSVEIERNAEIGQGTISRWKKANPRLDTLIQVLGFLGVEMFIRITLEPEEAYSGDIEEREISVTNIDDRIIELVIEILKSINLSDKERLYKILQAFL